MCQKSIFIWKATTYKHFSCLFSTLYNPQLWILLHNRYFLLNLNFQCILLTEWFYFLCLHCPTASSNTDFFDHKLAIASGCTSQSTGPHFPSYLSSVLSFGPQRKSTRKWKTLHDSCRLHLLLRAQG